MIKPSKLVLGTGIATLALAAGGVALALPAQAGIAHPASVSPASVSSTVGDGDGETADDAVTTAATTSSTSTADTDAETKDDAGGANDTDTETKDGATGAKDATDPVDGTGVEDGTADGETADD